MSTRASVCVFLGASTNAAPRLLDVARAFGHALARSRLAVVYGGCSTGLMGALADGAIDAGGEVIGVLPESLRHREPGHPRLSRLEVVADLAIRKRRMTAISDAFVALPGGYGTLDELFEVLTDRVVGLHQKPVAVLNHEGFYTPVLAFLDRAVTDGLLAQKERERLIVEDETARLVAHLATAIEAPHEPRPAR
jgi:uncharacterized protein (TIGR00730 family)